MAFVDTLFPNPKLIHDLEVEIGAPTTVIGNGNLEYRIQKQANYRTRWKWPSRAMLSTDAKEIATFLAEVGFFSLNSFKFKDPYLNQFLDTPLSYTGTGTKYYLTSQGTANTHPVFHLGGDIVVKRNGVTTTYTKQIVNGVPMIEVPATGTITITGTFYYAVRVDQAVFTRAMTVLNTSNGPLADTIGDVSLIEVFEY
jgi:hypothetical protein